MAIIIQSFDDPYDYTLAYTRVSLDGVYSNTFGWNWYPGVPMYDWLDENCNGSWHYYRTEIRFQKKEDALAFILRWI